LPAEIFELLFYKKNIWATFWAIFSQTQLVTLPPNLPNGKAPKS
jgi:hypothetical protein